MESFLTEVDQPKRNYKAYAVGAVVGLLLIAALVFIASLRPSMQDQMAAVLADAHREGSPEFAAITKDIIISTSDKTVQSPNAFGSISMFIVGTVKNRGTKMINGLEVNVAVIDQFNQVVKDKNVLVVPTQQTQLGPGETIPITLSIEGFKKDDDRANIRWKVTAIRSPAN